MAIEERPEDLVHGLDDVGHVDHLDHLIRGVAREMTSGEPSGALRAAVLRQVSRQGGWGTGLRPWAVAAVAVAGLVIAVVIAVVIGPAIGPAVVGPRGEQDRHLARVVPPAARQPTLTGEIERPVAAGDAGPPGSRAAARQVLANDVRDDPDRGDTVRIAPLEMSPIAITLLQPSAVDITAVPAPATVAIGEIEVTPLRLDETQGELVE